MDTKNEYFTCTGGGRALRTTGACFLSAGGFGRLTCGGEKHHGCLTLSLTTSHLPPASLGILTASSELSELESFLA